MTSLAASGHASAEPRRSRLLLAILACAALLVFCSLLALGTWQVHRRTWKLDLIAQVDARVHAAPTAPPVPADWPAVTAEADAYRHVRMRGSFMQGRETLVQAVTEEGAGDWVLTPFRTAEGFTVLVNRGFVPADRRDPTSRPTGQGANETVVTGLLRITEPNGAFLRSNDPADDRWYSRDVQAIAASRDLGRIAPYFVDADATPNVGGYPVGGLTIIAFPNNHLVYALTWYTLAALLGGAVVWVARDEYRRRGARS